MAHPHRQQRRMINVHDGSHGITKMKPKIRIVHVFAPEIIKIDAADFHELVQRLTGQPTKKKKKKKKKRSAETKTRQQNCKEEADDRAVRTMSNAVHENLFFGCQEDQEGVKFNKREDELYYDRDHHHQKELINCGGLMSTELEEFEDFFQDLSDLQFLPLTSSTDAISSQLVDDQ